VKIKFIFYFAGIFHLLSKDEVSFTEIKFWKLNFLCEAMV